jgi:hypothetical protein
MILSQQYPIGVFSPTSLCFTLPYLASPCLTLSYLALSNLDIQQSVLSMLSFTLTVDNYPDMVDFPYQSSLLYGIFFCSTALLGLFVFSSLTIASFQNEYSSLFAKATQVEK